MIVKVFHKLNDDNALLLSYQNSKSFSFFKVKYLHHGISSKILAVLKNNDTTKHVSADCFESSVLIGNFQNCSNDHKYIVEGHQFSKLLIKIEMNNLEQRNNVQFFGL